MIEQIQKRGKSHMTLRWETFPGTLRSTESREPSCRSFRFRTTHAPTADSWSYSIRTRKPKLEADCTGGFEASFFAPERSQYMER
ncbi:hypothetical protein SAMN02746089_02060 [Caldanaerobius fijiensis DSM 17918]|uniref:Uncharacterized protein n=1 Tax=Caldanaerobius fijiensis DSM 17918 TaxID=1121256 RepID=A0A1M5C877_9THEO|nr:hypothetical protein SAMN02746089_02060 [Caldanaerobius fijiensis DSM 17918]